MDGIGTWTGDIASSGNGTWRTSSAGTVSGGTGPSGPHSLEVDIFSLSHQLEV